MRIKRSDLIEFNVYLSLAMHAQLQILQDAGLSMSALSRLAIRKCAGMQLDAEESGSTPKRVLLYLHPDDSNTLDQIAAGEGDRSKGKALRRLISTYLRINASAIETMF